MWLYKYWCKQKGLFVEKIGGEMIPMNVNDGWGGKCGPFSNGVWYIHTQ